MNDVVETTSEVDTGAARSRPKKRNWAPYALIFPTVLFLALFFAWPMVRGLSLAVWDSEAFLSLREEPAATAPRSGQLRQNTPLEILDEESHIVESDRAAEQRVNMVTEIWYLVSGDGPDGRTVTGWAPEARIRVRGEDTSGNASNGTIRPRLGADSDPLTALFEEASNRSEIAGYLEQQAAVEILDQNTLETWFQVRGTNEAGEVVEGWGQSRFIQVFEDETKGRVDRGDTGELTTRFIQKMVDDRFFEPAVKTTLLLMILIIPVQFVLAVVMALVIQARLRGNTYLLYVFAIPLGVSDLAVGIVFFSIFTQNGFLNSILQGLGLIDGPITYLSAETRGWIIFAIWLAEVWRATAIVMIIIVSGLQAISDEVLEAAEIFGANLWRRVRYVILPLLRPSIQIALILRTILALQMFAVVIALSGGDVVTVLTNETYRQYRELRNPNVAAAYAVFILLLSMVSTTLYLYSLRTQKEKAE